jgi:plasmid stability protein
VLHEIRDMKNVTVSLDEEVAKWVRIFAAQHDKSVSRIVGEILKERMQDQKTYEKAMRQFLTRTPTALQLKRNPYPKWEELYERNDIR